MAATNRWTAIPERRLSGDADNDVFPCKRAVAEDTIEEFAAGNGRTDTKELPNWAVGFLNYEVGALLVGNDPSGLSKLSDKATTSSSQFGCGLVH